MLNPARVMIMTVKILFRWLAALLLVATCPAVSAKKIPRVNYTLHADHAWQMNSPFGERFDASGLALTSSGDLLTVNDRLARVYKIEFQTNSSSVRLLEVPDCFTPKQLSPFNAEKVDRYDTEGISLDSKGNIYISEEANRWILRWDAQTHAVERLPIDWTPVKKYFSADRNASFEGVAMGEDKLYVANERKDGRIIVVDPKTYKILDNFVVYPKKNKSRDVHYSDLSWWKGHLYILVRNYRVVLEVEPQSHDVVAEYDYADVELDPQNIYFTIFPTGIMEGLAVDDQSIWLATDNNGMQRAKHPQDRRPTLFHCPRPGSASESRDPTKK